MNSYNKKYSRTLFLLTISFLIFNLSAVGGFFSAEATVRYVSKTGLSIPPYTTWETAADSIQKCINISVFGDTIYVANGVYEEQVVMIPGLSLIGAGMDSCVIYFSTTFIPAVQVADTCLLKGFKILLPNTSNTIGLEANENGHGSLITLNKIVNASLGLYLDGVNTEVYKNVFENIKSRGIWIFNSNSIIRRNYIYTDPNSQVSTTGIHIGAFYNNYQPIIDSNYIVANRARGIEKSFGTRPIIKNNTIILINYGSQAIYLYSSDSVYINSNLILLYDGVKGISNLSIPFLQLTNNYIKGNNSPTGMTVGGSNVVKNNVVVNTVTGIEAGGIQNLVVQYNNLWNNNTNYSGFTPDTTNISFNPLIINDDTTQGKLDFHLQMFSPLIDAGDPNILDKDSTRSDIGLYGGPYGESYIYVDLPPRSPVNLTANVDSNIVTLKWNKNTEADFSYYNLFYDTTKNFQIDPTKLISSQPDTFYYFVIPTGVERLYFKLTAIDNQGNESNPSEEVAVILVSVDNEWKPVNNYILYQNYPNPFNPTTRIGYKLKERGYVKLYVYDIKGELVSVLVNQTQEAGYYEVLFDAGYSMLDTGKKTSGGGLASGVYIYQIFVKSENNIPVFSDIKKMVFIK
jgi:hypothetical protein